jgi:hypothetical protein
LGVGEGIAGFSLSLIFPAGLGFVVFGVGEGITGFSLSLPWSDMSIFSFL